LCLALLPPQFCYQSSRDVRRVSEMATLRFLDPRVPVDPEHRALSVGLDTLQDRVIGIIDNGQSNSTGMLRELARLIEERYRPAEVVFTTKPTHMQGAPAALMADVARRCDAVITGLGA
jgi:hypothetical protein